jgi:hypothetical protein
LKLAQGELILDVTSIQRRGRLKERDPHFFVRNGTVFDAPRHNQEFSLFKPDDPVAKVHADLLGLDEEECPSQHGHSHPKAKAASFSLTADC